MLLLIEVIIVIFLLLSLIVDRKIKVEKGAVKYKGYIVGILLSALVLQSYLGYILYNTEGDSMLFYLFPLEFFILGVQYQIVVGTRIENKAFNKFYAYYKTIMLICYFVFITVASRNIYPMEYVYLVKLSIVLLNLIFLIKTSIYLVKNKSIANQLFFASFITLLINTLHVIYNVVSISFGLHSLLNVYLVLTVMLVSCISVILYKVFSRSTNFSNVIEVDDQKLIAEELVENNTLLDDSCFETGIDNQPQSETGPKYEKSKLKFSDIEMIRLKIYQELVKNKAFLDPELNLQKFSEAINISKHSISQVFSTYYQSNFKEFTNKLRCEHAIELMAKHHDKHIIEIAYMCGFNSKTSFYRSFNKNFNISPTDYLSKNSNYR